MNNSWPAKCYKKDPNLVFRKIEDELLLVPIRQDVGDLQSIFTLNEVAARVWELIDGETKSGQIRDRILEEFDVSPETAEKDLIELLQKLIEIEAVREI